MSEKTHMEPNGIFLNRSFQMKIPRGIEEKQRQKHSTLSICSLKERKLTYLENSSAASSSSIKMDSLHYQSSSRKEVRRSSLAPASSSSTSSSSLLSSETGGKMMTIDGIHGTGQIHEVYYEEIKNSNYLPQEPQNISKNKRSPGMSEEEAEEDTKWHCASQGENRGIFNEWNNNNSNNNNSFYCSSVTAVTSSPSTILSSSTIVTANSGQIRGLKKIKSKSGVQGAGYYSNFSKISKSCVAQETMEDGHEDEAEEKSSSKDFATLPTNDSPSLLTWKLPSFLCLPFTNNDNDNSYLHLGSTSTKSTGILSLTSLLIVVMAVLLSVPPPVISATPTGETSFATDDINNDVASNDYPTTSASIQPVKLQTIQFTSPAEGTTPEDSGIFFSSSATGRTTGGSSGPSVTHQSVEGGVRQEPSMNDFPGWKDADSLTAHGASDVESSSDKVELLHPHEDDESELLHKEYEFKSGYPELQNETREALQEEGSNHQPVVFVGGSGYVPPNSIRTRPSLEGDPLYRPLAESRYPVPLQSAWDRNYRNPFNMTRVQHIEAECQDDFMKIRVAFNGSFQGLIYSSGYSYDPDCVYINGTGRDYYEYLIKLNRCGTLGASNHVEGRREPSKNFMWNTVTVQYNPMIEEEWDEHFKVTCEYGYDFWKTVTFPFLDVEVATGNPVVFTLTPPECYMEVRYGFGTAGTRVGGPVRVGDPLTLMINMRSQYDGFDIVVNDCYAHNGATKRIQLIDHYGCPVDSKLMSPFRGTWSHTNLYETQVYAYLKTFRFTGSPALYIECDVRMCHGQCPAQPCYWRNVKSISKRSTDTQEQQLMISDSEKNSTLSENLSLFQALRVLQEDEDTEALKTNLDTQESVCMKTGAFTAMIGLSTFILVILTVSTMIMCFRLRRVKVIEERETATDILRPYSHHVREPSSQSQQQRSHSHHRHHHHWSSAAKPR